MCSTRSGPKRHFLRGRITGSFIFLRDFFRSSCSFFTRAARGGSKAETREVPLVKCYAFRDGDRYAIAVLSLKLDGKHNGQDFGDGYSPVKLRLPFASARTIHLTKLVGDPRDNNREREKVKLVEQSVPASALRAGVFQIDQATGGGKGGIPPGTAFIYVFEGARP